MTEIIQDSIDPKAVELLKTDPAAFFANSGRGPTDAEQANADFYYRLGNTTQLEAVGEDELTEHYNTLPIHDQLVRDHRSVELQRAATDIGATFTPVDTHLEMARLQASVRHLSAYESGAYPRPIGVGGWLAIAAAVLILSLTGYAYFAGLAS